MSTEPEALRLADALDAEFLQGRISNSTGRESAVELRRLALKQWVGLTDEDREFLLHQALRFYDTNAQLLSFIKTVEEKLK